VFSEVGEIRGHPAPDLGHLSLYGIGRLRRDHLFLLYRFMADFDNVYFDANGGPTDRQ
jgi:hypothetical protein